MLIMSTSQQNQAPSESEQRLNSEFLPDVERLRVAVTALNANLSEATIHEFRVAGTVLLCAVTRNRVLLKRKIAKQVCSDLRILVRSARTCRTIDVRYQQMVAASLSVSEATQMALQPTLNLLEAKRDRARTEMATLTNSDDFHQLVDSVCSRLQPPVLRRRYVSVDAQSVEEVLAGQRLETGKAFLKLLAKTSPNSSREKLHDLRTAAKRARYALQGVDVSDEAAIARVAQTTLGSLRDSQALVAWLSKRLQNRTTSQAERHAIASVIDVERAEIRRRQRRLKELRQQTAVSA